jgi:hypothetical protein
MNAPASPRFRKLAPWLFRIALVVTVLTLIVVTQLNASHRNAKIAAPGAVIVAPFTGFAGYNWSGNVGNISAQWRVPTISSTSQPGYASTWIGVQNDVNNQFVQIGIVENDYGDGPDQYEAFWSDLQEGFSPQTFGVVFPGDLVAVSMTRSEKGWRLNFVDKSRALKGKQFVTLSASVRFTQGEWIQEDPSPSTNATQDLPYPNISNVVFQALKVNGVAPKLNMGDSEVLISFNGTIRIPTPVVDDSFTLAAPVGAARQYLDDEQTLDTALNEFNVQLATLNSASGSESSVATSLSNALRTDVQSLRSQTWPAASMTAVARLVQSDATQLHDIAAWSNDDYNTKGLAFTQFKEELDRSERLVDALRATLDIPPL